MKYKLTLNKRMRFVRMTTAESNGSTVVPEISVWFGSEYTVMEDKRDSGEACGYCGIQSFGSHVAGVDVCK